MPRKINDTGKPIFVNGRDIPEGAFYDAPDLVEVAEEVENDAFIPYVIPEEKDITMPAIKDFLDKWGAVYTAEQTKDKAALYAFFVNFAQEANKLGDAAAN